MEIRRLGTGDIDTLLAASHLFDGPVEADLARGFLDDPGHHCLLAIVDGEPVGFVTGVTVRHPDKADEMLLYELGVDEAWRERGFGTALVTALKDLAAESGFRGMWVLTERANDVALRTYRSAGADGAEEATVLEWRLDPAM
jgi:aminoglycoside 3-N-acetyltransferase I